MLALDFYRLEGQKIMWSEEKQQHGILQINFCHFDTVQ